MKRPLLTILLALLLLAAGCTCAAAERLLLPADTLTIQAEAFCNTADLDTVVLPEGLTTIGARAFAGSSLTAVNLPASLTAIAADAFDGCSGLHLTVVSGTPGEAYAIASGLPYTLLPAGPVDAGVYTFIHQATGSYLAWQDTALTLSPEPQPWTLRQAGSDAFHLTAGDTGLLLDIDNAYVAEGSAVKLWEPTGYDVQIWRVRPNSNGTFSILYSGDERFCLGFADGHGVLQLRDPADPAQEWRMACVAVTAPWQYLSVTGQSDTVELRLAPDVLSVIGETRLQQWADDLETAYSSFYQLTGFLPYPNIIVEGYKPSEYVGWVTDHSNIIHIDSGFLMADLEKMAARTGNWNFCALHEMGHMFDMERPWNFETECLTDLKLAYVLEVNNASAAPSEFDADQLFTGAGILEAYRMLGSDFSEEYSIYGLAARFLEIKEQIGWEPFLDTFHDLQANDSLYTDYTAQQKLETFISLLSGYSGQTIIDAFSDAEWRTVLDACH